MAWSALAALASVSRTSAGICPSATEPMRTGGEIASGRSPAGAPLAWRKKAAMFVYDLFAQSSAIGGRHGGLNVADQVGGGARSPGIHEIAARPVAGPRSGRKDPADGSSRSWFDTPRDPRPPGRGVGSRSLAPAADSHDGGDGDHGQQRHSVRRHFSRAFYRKSGGNSRRRSLRERPLMASIER